MTIAIIGHYGKDNVGDEAMLEVLLHYLGKEKSVVLGLNTRKVQDTHQVRSFNLLNFPSATLALLNSNVIIFGGGAIIKNHSLIKLSPFMLLSKLSGKKMVFFGIDVYPLVFPLRVLVRFCMNGSELINVRNSRSLSVLQKIGINKPVSVCDDLTFMLPIILGPLDFSKETNSNNGGKVVGMNLRPPTFTDPFNLDYFINQTRKLLLSLSKQNHLVVRLIAMQPSDEQVLSDFALSLKENSNITWEWVQHGYNVRETLKAFKNCDLVIGMRYHSLVFAVLMKVFFIAIPYSLKVETFAQDFEECGCNGNGINIKLPEKHLEILKEYVRVANAANN
jgi:polysaccharide pyruvyl transferase CsaB